MEIMYTSARVGPWLRLRRLLGRRARAATGPTAAVLVLAVMGALAGLVIGSYHVFVGTLTSVGHGTGAGSDTLAGLEAIALVAVGVLGAGIAGRHPLAAAALLLAAGLAGVALFERAWLAVGSPFVLGTLLEVVGWIRGLRSAEAPPWSEEHWR